MPKIIEIHQGDSVSRIAAAHGLAPDTIWDHPDNAELKGKRKHMDVLAPGDWLTVPDRRGKTIDCCVDQRHRFRLRGVPMLFQLQLLDAWGKPRADRPYRLLVDGRPYEGTTDEDGVLRQYVHNHARRGRLELDELELDMELGHLDPLSELVGVQQRLTNMGFPCLGDRGEMGQATLTAIERFQALTDLEVTGELDERTREAIGTTYEQPGRLAQLSNDGEAP